MVHWSRATSSFSNCSVLPCEDRVGHTLERLAEHHVFSGGGIERTEMQIGQPATSPSVTPFCREHDKVERMAALYLEPRRAACAGIIGGVNRLHHDALVTVSDRLIV